MKVAVTGSSGFLGKNLIRLLSHRGARVLAHRRTAAVDAELPGVAHVVTDDGGVFAAEVRRFTPDCVVHLATHYLKAHTPGDIAALLDANVRFGTELYEGLLGTESPIVSAMSFFQFDRGASDPLSLYAATKQAFLDIGDYYRRRHGLDIRHTVLYDTYGPDDTRDKLVPALLRGARSGDPVRLGARAQLIDLVYVDDVVEGLLAAGAPESATMTTVRSSRPVEVGQLAELVGALPESRLTVSFDDTRPLSERVTTAGDWPPPLGWQPRITLETGLRRSFDRTQLAGAEDATRRDGHSAT